METYKTIESVEVEEGRIVCYGRVVTYDKDGRIANISDRKVISELTTTKNED